MKEYLNNSKNFRLLTLKNILTKYSDDDHPLSSAKIIKLMKNESDINCTRKTIYNEINSLIDFGMDINKFEDRKKGVYLGARRFEIAEIRLLIDAVLTAKFITPKKTKELIEKLYSNLSVYQIESLNQQIHIDTDTKYDNEEIYYNVDHINEAILKHKKIRFLYKHKTLRNNHLAISEGKIFTVSPYALIWSNDRYYLTANNDKYKNLSNYRLEKMSKVELLNENIRPIEEVSDYKGKFDVIDYIKKNINMFPGEKEILELVCKSEFFEILSDKFGKNIKCKKTDRDEFTVKLEIYNSKALIDWLVGNATRIKVKSPKHIYDKVREKIIEISKIYDVE